jgi:hypothetical protein
VRWPRAASPASAQPGARIAADMNGNSAAMCLPAPRPIRAICAAMHVAGTGQGLGFACGPSRPPPSARPTVPRRGRTCRRRCHTSRGPARQGHIVEVEGSHVIMISQPQVVADTIMKALEKVA